MSKIVAPAMAYISGEEMTHYAMQLIRKEWLDPHVDTSAWEFFDLSAKHRDDTEDQALKDAVAAGARIGAIFKEPTVTPTEEQRVSMGLKKTWGSPNGAMRKGWNGMSISRDCIMVPGLTLGYKNPVLFDRHAVGGEYGAAWKEVGKGKVVTTFHPADGSAPITVDERELKNNINEAVFYHNPLDNVYDLAQHFFSRSLETGVTPYIVTKKTVFKWQERFWQIFKEVFDKSFKEKFAAKGLLKNTNGELAHLISDAACMELIKWTDGGFSMVAHNYDGDMLTDLMSQVHRSPGFISSVLIGKREDGARIMEFEASHGTVAAMWKKHKEGKETSMNPLGMVDALIGAMDHSARLVSDAKLKEVQSYTAALRAAMYKVMTGGKGTRDLAGPQGSTTEQFIAEVAKELGGLLQKKAA